MGRLRLHLICDNELTAEALAAALEERFVVTGRGSFDDARRNAPNLDAEIVLIDATGVAQRALELVRELGDELGDEHRELRLLPVGLDGCEQAVDFLEAGAAGYAMKTDSFAAVIGTVEAVAAGRPPCSPRVTALVFERIGRLAQGRGAALETVDSAQLSHREREVLELLAQGFRNKEIARRLGLALSTAGNHVQHVLEKLGVNRRRDAVRLGYGAGLISRSMPTFPFPFSNASESA